ncbi:MAG: RNA methyltransferase [Candidatus Thermoplasmatota archaeon]|nr:RNA methyltransferase [Euryarchaeota archaeon]MBU4031519.1 RNA methyltransferase [Candidatus Thermoplasmatota archaeon]MBU4072008.1 RNA methyltransferase [Candidatus Thermoplasmatota archaeon]MBU4144539.1 RNA methyltransferase [Candidatus Thermoplasmatota archaeon]MBU4592088.1 RNA methyltransferase [Candidatus Thermoplasmatota archaeon]
MPEYIVILMEPKFPGNIGSVARAMSNFDLGHLVLVNPCELGDDAYRYSKHGRYILENAMVVNELSEALDMADIIVGSTGKPTDSNRKFLREPITPKQLATFMASKTGRVGLLFGREDRGLLNEELKNCDILVTIPTHEINPILNLSHAATILFYELFSPPKSTRVKTFAGSKEKKVMNKLFADLLEEITYQPYKKEKTKVMFRKIVARAGLSSNEFHTLAGVFSRAVKVVKRLKQEK